MKQILFSSFIILISGELFATAQFGTTCPTSFIGTVISVDDIQSSNFPKIEVNFKVLQTLKGNSFTSKKIQVVKDSVIDFKMGQVYSVEMRDNWLCNASILTSK